MDVLFVRASSIYDDSRATKEILALLEKGHNVHVVGWDRNGDSKNRTEQVFSKYSEQIVFDFFSFQLEQGIGLRNIDKLLEWIRWTNKVVKKNRHYDVVHACNLDGALGVWKYARKNGIKIIYDIYDYYIDSHKIPKGLENLVERLEINIINAADATIICTEERREQIAKAVPRKLEVIHNSPNVAAVDQKEILYDYTYCGSLYGQRLLQEIFDAYSENNHIRFGIAGSGEFADMARDLDNKFESFSYLGPLSYDEVLDIESKSKVISAIYEPSIRNHRLCAPNKFYEALALAKPVIVCRNTGIDKIVEKNRIGIVIDYDPHQFYEALNYLLSNQDACFEMGLNARHLYEQKYKWDIMKERLVKLYDEIR